MSAQFSARSVTAGQRFLVELGGVYYCGVVVYDGGWRSDDENLASPVGLCRYSSRHSSYRSMHRALNGGWVAMGLHRLSSAATVADLEDSRMKSWRPEFVRQTNIVRAWDEHVAEKRKVAADMADRARREKVERDTRHAAVRAIVSKMHGAQGADQFMRNCDNGNSYANADKFGLRYDGDRLMVTTTEMLTALAAFVTGSDATAVVGDVVERLTRENSELRRRMETAEEKVNALRFILN